MKRALFATALALTVAASPASAATNLLTNGSFEVGSGGIAGFTGWTVTTVPANDIYPPTVINYNQSSGYPTGAFNEAVGTNSVSSGSPDAVGNRLAYFSSDIANPHTISQLVNLVAGTTYNIGFDYYVPRNGFNNPNDATLSFLLDGNVVGSTLQAGSVSGTPVASWQNFSTSFVAGSTGAQTLAFQFRGLGVTAADFGVDRVYVTAAVPEPGTWALMLLGFGAVGVAMRRRRRPMLQMA